MVESESPEAPSAVSFRVHDDGVYRRGRQPSDLLRTIVALATGVIGYLMASALDTVSIGVASEVISAFEKLPSPLVVTTILAVQLLAWALPVVVVAVLVVRRRYRRLALVALAVTAAGLVSWGIQGELAGIASTELTVTPPSWVCANLVGSTQQSIGAADPNSVGNIVTQPDTLGQVLGSHACVPGDGFPSIVYLAGLAAAISTLTPWLNRKWRRATWIVLVIFLMVRVIDGLLPPIDALLMMALGYAIGGATLLAFGSPDRTPKTFEVATALTDHGFDITSIEPTGAAADERRRFSARLGDGRSVYVKLRTPEDRAAEVLFRVYRMIRLKGFGDERPFASLRREVGHEAGMSLSASAAGVRTPQMLRVADVPPNSMLIVFEETGADALDGVDERLVTDEVLRSIWDQIGRIRDARIAHRHLTTANVLLDSGGHAWIVDFGFAELSADERELNGDTAQLLVALALIVGAQRSVAAAVEGLGPEAVAASAARIQPTALSSSTRSAAKKQKALLGELRDEVKAVTNLETVDLEKLERVSSRTVFTTVMLGFAFYLLIPQLAQVDFGEVVDADWQWFPLVLLFSFLTYVGASIALIGAMPTRLRFFPTLLAQLAASFFNRIAPAKVGGIAANIRYLQKSGVDPAVAVAGVGLNNVAGVITHVLLLAVFVTTAGRSATDVISLPSGQTVLLGLVAVLTAAGGVMVLPWGRKLWLRRISPIMRKSAAGVAKVTANPAKILALFTGSFSITMSYVFALWYSIAAFGGGIGFVGVTAVYLAGSALAQAAPTPGGVGAAEAALIAGLTTFGLSATVAVPAVFLFRIGTFWFPVLPGYIAYKRLEARQLL